MIITDDNMVYTANVGDSQIILMKLRRSKLQETIETKKDFQDLDFKVCQIMEI